MQAAIDTPQLGARSLLIAAAFGLAVAAFHLWHGAPLAHSVLMQSFNWVYDFDSSRFVGGWCTPGADVAQDMDIAFVARHLLSLGTRPLCLGLNRLIGNPALSLMALTALCAGLSASLAYGLAAAFCAREFDRLLLALGYAVSVHPLMMGVIPETYGWALMGVGLHMMLRAQRRDRAPDAGAWSVFSLFLDLGITVTNAALNLLSSAVLAWRRMSRQRWLRICAVDERHLGHLEIIIKCPWTLQSRYMTYMTSSCDTKSVKLKETVRDTPRPRHHLPSQRQQGQGVSACLHEQHLPRLPLPQGH